MDFVEVAETSVLHHTPENGRFTITDANPNTLDDHQLLMIAIIGAISSYISVLASFLLKGMMTRGEKWGSYHRLVLMAALSNALTANFFALSPLFNCTLSGFLMQAGLSSILYQAMVSVYYFLEVRCRIDKSVIATRYEMWLHLFPAVVGYGLATSGLPLLGSYNVYGELDMGLSCWVRGEIFPGSMWVFYGIPFLWATAIHVFCTTSVIVSARQGIRDTAHVVEQQNHGSRGRLFPVVAMSKTEVACAMYAEATQCFWFAFSSIFCYGWMMALRVIDLLGGRPVDYYWLLLIAYTMYPLYGFFQLFVCLLPEVHSKQDRHPEMTTVRAMTSAFFRTPSVKHFNRSSSNADATVSGGARASIQLSLPGGGVAGGSGSSGGGDNGDGTRRLSTRAEILIANLAPRRSSTTGNTFGGMSIMELEQRRERQRRVAQESQIALEAAAMENVRTRTPSMDFSSNFDERENKTFNRCNTADV